MYYTNVSPIGIQQILFDLRIMLSVFYHPKTCFLPFGADRAEFMPLTSLQEEIGVLQILWIFSN